jgi:hypothetical protein
MFQQKPDDCLAGGLARRVQVLKQLKHLDTARKRAG